jgi:hypothetical protein
MNKIEQLMALQQSIAANGQDRLFASPTHDLLHLEFDGESQGTAFDLLLDALCQAEFAAAIESLVFRGPDLGANGTRNWDFTRLIQSGVIFPKLRSFEVRPSTLLAHNHTIIAETYDEDGQIAALVANMPLLQTLIVPSAPNIEFFAVELSELRVLQVEAGYDHQNFIHNLSLSHNMPQLKQFCYSDITHQNLLDPSQSTPFQAYEQLFSSPAIANVNSVVLQNVRFSHEQIQLLKSLKPECYLRIVPEPQIIVA